MLLITQELHGIGALVSPFVDPTMPSEGTTGARGSVQNAYGVCRLHRECADCTGGVQIAPGVCKLPHQYVVFALSRVLRVSLSLYIQSIPANRSGPVPFGT